MTIAAVEGPICWTALLRSRLSGIALGAARVGALLCLWLGLEWVDDVPPAPDWDDTEHW